MDKLFTDAANNKRIQTAVDGTQEKGGALKQYPKGVVLDKDGKPCRSCTSKSAFSDWAAMTKKNIAKDASVTATSVPSEVVISDCPPDVEELGRNTWTFLHTMSASYPSRASPTQQSEMRQFLNLFGKLYPCWVCAEDFQEWMARKGNEPAVEGRDRLGRWMCNAHNEVNKKLGKQEFDCEKWEERWRTGWKDGRCD